MKLWRYGKDDSLNMTETRAVLAVKLTQLVFYFLGASALASFLVAVFTRGKTVIKPDEFWFDVLVAVFAFLASLHGVAWVGGWTKQREAPKVAAADAIRAGAQPSSTTVTTTKTTAPTAPTKPTDIESDRPVVDDNDDGVM